MAENWIPVTAKDFSCATFTASVSSLPAATLIIWRVSPIASSPTETAAAVADQIETNLLRSGTLFTISWNLLSISTFLALRRLSISFFWESYSCFFIVYCCFISSAASGEGSVGSVSWFNSSLMAIYSSSRFFLSLFNLSKSAESDKYLAFCSSVRTIEFLFAVLSILTNWLDGS